MDWEPTLGKRRHFILSALCERGSYSAIAQALALLAVAPAVKSELAVDPLAVRFWREPYLR